MNLQKVTAHWLDTAVASYKATGEEVRMFHSFMYKADSWKHQQRVVVKIEVNSLGTNVRYVVTDFKGQRSSFIYSECYCDRGRMEQMIAELKNGLKADRMSCNKFSANQLRLYLHCAAYVILHSFQADMLVGTELECSTITTMREKLLPSAVSCAFWTSSGAAFGHIELLYQKNHAVPGKCGPIGQLLRRQSMVAMNNAG